MIPTIRCTILGSLLLSAVLTLTVIETASAADVHHFEVRKFGAQCDGSADDTESIRKAAEAASKDGGELSFPSGTCVIHGTISIGSHVHVVGKHSTLLAALPWNAPHPQAYAMLENVHTSEGGTPDVDLVVQGMTFDFGTLGPGAVAGGGKHAIRFEFASNILVEHNVFQVRTAEDAVAGVGVHQMTVRHNEAYDFRNCAYDFWAGPSDIVVESNQARTETSAQMVNFNPERAAGSSAGLVAHDFQMQRNTLTATGPKAVPIQLEPLGGGTSVSDVVVTDNTLDNVFIAVRGAVSHAQIRNNVIRHVRGGYSAIESYPHFGATADQLTIVGNKIEDAETNTSELGIIRVEAKTAQIDGNTIAGSPHTVPDYYRGAAKP